MTADARPQTTATGNYADVNGINLYYERHGSGRPMVLLHGGLFSIDSWAPILPRLTHYNMAESPLVATTVLDFLDAA
jgi:pimeloyl-ACP methyl ester carboxylesterase